MDKDLKEFIKFQLENVKIDHITIHIKNKYPEFYNRIIERTKYLNTKKFAERIYHIMNDLFEVQKCYCGKNLRYISYGRGYPETCSIKCYKNIEGNNMFKLKPDSYIKMRKTNLERYGVENPAKSKIVKDKISKANKKLAEQSLKKRKKTNMERYGKEYYTNAKKRNKTLVDRYGVDNIFKLSDFQDRYGENRKLSIFNRMVNRLKPYVTPLFTIDEYRGVHDKNKKPVKYMWKCKKCGNEFKYGVYDGIIPRCVKCYPHLSGTSKLEQEVQEFVRMNIKSEDNKRFYLRDRKFYELDVYIDSLNFGIEFNGLYWHSELNGEKDKNYHIDKTNYFKSMGINLMHIYEDEWIFKQKIVKSMIKNKLGLIKNKIYARKTTLKLVENFNEVERFLELNHIQGSVNSSINVGLYYNDELVSLMTFSKPRFTREYDWELVRFTNKINYSIVGGASKLFKWFTKNYSGTILSYADLRYSTGNLYNILGFVESHKSSPNYYYIKDGQRLRRNSFQKKMLKNKMEIYSDELTEWEIMQLNGYDRIWDCGNLVYKWGLK